MLTCAARAARGSATAHNSMLVRVTRFTIVQEHVGDQLKELVSDVRERITLGEPSARAQLYDELRALWEDDFELTTAEIADPDCPPVSWAQIEAHIQGVAASLVVRVINGTAGDILDYETHKDIGLNVIAVGGDKLARGFALEGLCDQLLSARVQDVRHPDADGTLVWLPARGTSTFAALPSAAELHESFEHITAANEELQLEFNHMAVTGGTPADYGLKVRSHPDLMVTSIVKMRSGTSLQISFAGVVSETVVFDRDREVNTSEHRQRQRPCSRGFVRPTNAEQFGSHPEPHGQLRVDRSQP